MNDFQLQQQEMEELTAEGEEKYRSGMVAEVRKRIEEELPLWLDSDLDELIAFCEVELRERHDARERAVQEYADDLPF